MSERDSLRRSIACVSGDASAREAALAALSDDALAAHAAQLRAAVASAEALSSRRAVDAAVAAAVARSAAEAAAAQAARAADAAPKCVVCWGAAPAVVVLALAPCGHRCVCAGCVPQLPGRQCPVCRAAFTDAIRVFD